MDLKKILGDVLWITKDGDFDLAKFPIDSVLKQALSEDDQKFRTGLSVLSSMCRHGRREAGVFLMGVLLICDNDWEKRITIVESMKFIKTKPCADLRFSELSSQEFQHDPAYLGAVIEVLSSMPSELIEAGFRALADDSSFSPRMREKFRTVLEKELFGNHGW